MYDILLMMGANSGKGSSGGMINMMFMIGMIVVMYFFMIRPQMKKAKEQKEFSNSVNEGDKIITVSGIHGKIVKMNEDGTFSLQVSPNVFMTMEKSAISMEMTMALRKKLEAKAA